MSIWDQIEEYRRQVLIAHWRAFNNIQHAPTKGKMRERTVSILLQEEFGIIPVSGIACDERGDWQSPELDIIILSDKSRQGTPSVYHLDDLLATCEVKSYASTSDFKSAEASAEKLKRYSCGKIETTLFAFATRAHRATVCAKFGFPFDSTIAAHTDYNRNSDNYLNIDHFISLDASYTEQPYIITKDLNGERSLQIGGRTIENFLKLFQKVLQ